MKSLVKRLLVIFPLLILFVPLLGDTTEANAQQLRETFRRVKQSVVIVRTQEKTVAPLLRQGLVNSGGQASGVLISDDGRVLTAAHVVQAVDKVFVEFSAVTAINEALTQRDASEPAHSNPGALEEYEASELYASSFEATFAALGRADFERAWSLAQQLAAKDISVLAQLAACRGGLDRPW